MDDPIRLSLLNATTQQQTQTAEQLIDSAWQTLRPKFVEVVRAFLAQPTSPALFFQFELALLTLVREFGRLVLQATINALEPDDARLSPLDFWFQSSGYRRRTEKTRNPFVATLLGTVILWRRGYRSWDGTDRTIFPVEMLLGLSDSVSPGLIDWLGRQMAEAGASQSRVLELLRQECGVAMGVKRLRSCTEQLSQAFAGLRQVHQVELLLAALEKARTSRGNRKPVLAVGRDGITLREYTHRVFEVATAATVSVYDRAGQRPMPLTLRFFVVAERRKPSGFVEFCGNLPDGSRRSATKVSGIGPAAGDGVLGLATRIGSGDDGPHADRFTDGVVRGLARPAAAIGVCG